MAFLSSYKQQQQQGDLSETLLVGKQRHGLLGSVPSSSVNLRWPVSSAMSGSVGGGGDHELEEGEACDDPESSCDPDTAFAYLDEKLSMVLGDVQKAFEGGVSAEKLGSKYGGYGSFLPTHERLPSVLHQERPMAATEAHGRIKKSPNEGIVEKIKRTVAGPSTGAVTSKAPFGSSISTTNESASRDDGTTNQKKANVDSLVPAPKTGENSGPPKGVRLKFKVGSDNSEKKRNASIYSDFGFTNSSSSEADDDDEEVGDQRSDSDFDSSPDRTPLTMIRIMTSHHLPDGILLSPLPDLIPEPFSHARETLADSNRSPYMTKLDGGNYSELVKDEGENLKEKFREGVSERKGDNMMSFEHEWKKAKVEKGSVKDSGKHVKPPSKSSSKINEIIAERQVKDAASESGNVMRSFEAQKEPKVAVPDYNVIESEHAPKDFSSPFEPRKDLESMREAPQRVRKIEKAAASSSHDSMNDPMDISQQLRDVVKDTDFGIHGKRQSEFDIELSDVKRKSFTKDTYEKKTSQDALKSMSKVSKFGKPLSSADATSRETGKEEKETKKKTKESLKDTHGSGSSSKDRGKEGSKEARKSSGKDKHFKEMSRDAIIETPHHSFKTIINKEHSEKDTPKISTEPRKKDKLKDRNKSDLLGREFSKSVEKERQKDFPSRDMHVKAAHAFQTPFYPEAVIPDKPPDAGAVQPPLETNLSYDHWVGCDKCLKWRLLPPGVTESSLPQKWRCKMLDWLKGMNSCSVSEEETTQATRALFGLPLLPPIPADVPPLEQQLQQPPAKVSTVTPFTITTSSQEMKVDKNKVTLSKKRKVPSAASTDIVSNKNKGSVDGQHSFQDISHAKPSGADSHMNQEGNQVKLGSADSSHAKASEEKRKVKDKDRERHKDREKEREKDREKDQEKDRERDRDKDREKDREKKRRLNDGTSPVVKEHSQSPATLAIREAVNLKHHADRLKGKPGIELEATGLYLQAALKFLQAAYMLESEGGEHGDNMNPLNIYTDTAKLCDFCAANYERNKDLAAAALAYKCAGLARMRVVHAKSSSTNRDRAEIMSAHQQVAPGESPSSSIASDVDNLNHLTIDRLPAKGTASPLLNSQTGAAFIIPARSRPSYNRILLFVEETISAIDVLSKANNAFIAADAAHTYPSESIDAVKRVLDYGFHDVDGLVRLVRIAMEAMGK